APVRSREANSALPFSSCVATAGLVPPGAGKTFLALLDWLEQATTIAISNIDRTLRMMTSD
ncbi:MAG TPA: hypothetical protein VKB81_03680, partial [Nitrospira sp.]|nr:hypothetical protein [Nitrospira sp.]